jgi:hypothetical protein
MQGEIAVVVRVLACHVRMCAGIDMFMRVFG